MQSPLWLVGQRHADTKQDVQKNLMTSELIKPYGLESFWNKGVSLVKGHTLSWCVNPMASLQVKYHRFHVVCCRGTCFGHFTSSFVRNPLEFIHIIFLLKSGNNIQYTFVKKMTDCGNNPVARERPMLFMSQLLGDTHCFRHNAVKKPPVLIVTSKHT